MSHTPQYLLLSRSLQTLLKIIFPVLLLIYVAFHSSVEHWILLGLLACAVLAIYFRLGNVATEANQHSVSNTIARNYDRADGGSFGKTTQQPQEMSARPVVNDGGSFERPKS